MKRTLISLIGLSLVVIGFGTWLFFQRGKSQQYVNTFSISPGAQEVSPGNESEPSSQGSEKEISQVSEETSIQHESSKEGTFVSSSEKNTLAEPSKSGSKLIIQKHFVSFGFTPKSERKIDTVILHSSYNNLGGDKFDTEKIWKEWKDAEVSPHYYIDREGVIYQLVKESNIAYHAGVSSVPDGRTNVNSFSIGIELNGTLDSGYTEKQYANLKALITDIKSRYTIKYVLGHSDIAPGRKTDPWSFNWKKLQ